MVKRNLNKNTTKSSGNDTINNTGDQDNNSSSNESSFRRSLNQLQPILGRPQRRRSEDLNLNGKLVFFKENGPNCRKYKVITTTDPYTEIAKQNRKGYAFLFNI